MSISIIFGHLYDSLSSNSKVILMGEFNGDLGNSLGDKSKREPNEGGLKLVSFANVFNLSLVNLINMCNGPPETFNSFFGDITLLSITFLFPIAC